MAKYISIDKLKVMASYSKLAEKGMCKELQEIIANAEKCAEDVIERAKVDKAIEELQNMKVYKRTRTARLVSLPEVFEILKRNIGEQVWNSYVLN